MIQIDKRGMTAVEMLISVAVLSVIGTALVAILAHSITGFSSGVSNEVSISQATIALQKLANEIREAKSAAVSGEALVVTFPLEVGDSSTGERIYDISADDPIMRTYYVSNGNLVRNVNGAVSIVARGISSATFATSGRNIYITLTSSEQVGRKTACAQVTGRIALRNFKN